MTQYIALIRGINVGGKNAVAMGRLRERCEAAGFSNVSTYLNSGNVIFSSELSDLVRLVAIHENILVEDFNVSAKVAVIPVVEFHDAVAHAPEWWGKNADAKHNALFVIAPADAEEIIQEVGEAKPEYEKVDSYQHVIFWSAPLKTFHHTRWSKVVSTKAYDSITIRNANTVRKLYALTK